MLNLAIDANMGKARTPSDTVEARVLATASTAEQITVPSDATHVILSATQNIFFKVGTNPTAAVPSADVTDGSASELITPNTPTESRTFQVTGQAKISVVSDTDGAIVTAAFYKQ